MTAAREREFAADPVRGGSAPAGVGDGRAARRGAAGCGSFDLAHLQGVHEEGNVACGSTRRRHRFQPGEQGRPGFTHGRIHRAAGPPACPVCLVIGRGSRSGHPHPLTRAGAHTNDNRGLPQACRQRPRRRHPEPVMTLARLRTLLAGHLPAPITSAETRPLERGAGGGGRGRWEDPRRDHRTVRAAGLHRRCVTNALPARRQRSQ